MTDTEDGDKKKIKIEEAADEIAAQQNRATIHGQDGSPQNANQAPELISTENASTLVSEADNTVTSASLPTTVITTQKHRMITTAGQIQYVLF